MVEMQGYLIFNIIFDCSKELLSISPSCQMLFFLIFQNYFAADFAFGGISIALDCVSWGIFNTHLLIAIWACYFFIIFFRLLLSIWRWLIRELMLNHLGLKILVPFGWPQFPKASRVRAIHSLVRWGSCLRHFISLFNIRQNICGLRPLERVMWPHSFDRTQVLHLLDLSFEMF